MRSLRVVPAVLAVLAALAAAMSLTPVRAREELRVASLSLPPEAALPYWPREVIVQFRDGADDTMVERAVRVTGGERARRSSYGRRYLVRLTEGMAVADAIERFRSFPEVEYAEPNGMVRAFQAPGRFMPNDRLYASQWHLRLLDAERTWGIQKCDSSVVIAVLDSGVAFEDYGAFRKAPDFDGTTFVTGFNTITRDAHANDDNFHGTHVASVIAESTNNSVGVAGLAFGCGIMPVKVLDRNGLGSFFMVAEGMDYATNFMQGGQRPVKVINLSLGGDSTSQTMTQAVGRAVLAGITVVAAAGNESQGTVSFPASLSNVIAVGAVDGRKAKAPYSNFGSALDLVAFGGDNRRDDVGGPDGRSDNRPDGILQQTFNPDTARLFNRFDDFAYFYVVGTSQATPQVSALAGLLYRQGITTPAAIQAAMEQTAEDLGNAGRDDTYGHGLIRPQFALSGLGLGR
jgi:serine protease